MFPIWKTII